MHNHSSMGTTVVRDSLGSLSGLTGNTQDKIIEPKPMESFESEVKTDELAHQNSSVAAPTSTTGSAEAMIQNVNQSAITIIDIPSPKISLEAKDTQRSKPQPVVAASSEELFDVE